MVILRIIRWQVFCRKCLTLSRFIELVGFPGGAVVKTLPISAGDTRDVGLIPGMGGSSGVGHGNLLQYSCLENSRDSGRLEGCSIWGHIQLSDWACAPSVVNIIHFHGSIHHPFCEVLSGIETKYPDLPYHLAIW